MDTTNELPIIISLLSFAVSVLTLLYLKREVSILKRNFEMRKNLEKTSNAILQVIDIIKKTSKPTSFESLKTIQADILREMHDNPELMGLTLEITPEPLHLNLKPSVLQITPTDITMIDLNAVTIAKTEDLISVLMNWANRNVNFGGTLHFRAEPEILKTDSIVLDDLLSEARMYSIAYKILKENEDTIRSCDNTVIETMKNFKDQMVNSIFMSISRKHILNFDSHDTSSDILRKLADGIIDLTSIVNMRNSLVAWCDDKLVSVQQKLFAMSYQ